MDSNKVRSILIEEFSDYLGKQGFNLNDKDFGLSFVKHVDSRIEHIFFSLSEFGSKHNIYSPGCGIRFSTIEEIRANVLKQDDAENIVTVLPYNEYDGKMDDILPGPLDYVQNEDDVRRVINILKPYIEKYILPFFAKYPTLKEVDTKIQQTPIVELHKFIGQEVIGRRMIIMKLAGNAGYDEYLKMIFDYFTGEAKKGNAEAKSDLEKYTKLRDYLAANVPAES